MDFWCGESHYYGCKSGGCLSKSPVRVRPVAQNKKRHPLWVSFLFYHLSRSGDASLDKEAVRVISSMPKWKPGTQRGKPVRVTYTIPVNFRLG